MNRIVLLAALYALGCAELTYAEGRRARAYDSVGTSKNSRAKKSRKSKYKKVRGNKASPYGRRKLRRQRKHDHKTHGHKGNLEHDRDQGHDHNHNHDHGHNHDHAGHSHTGFGAQVGVSAVSMMGSTEEGSALFDPSILNNPERLFSPQQASTSTRRRRPPPTQTPGGSHAGHNHAGHDHGGGGGNQGPTTGVNLGAFYNFTEALAVNAFVGFDVEAGVMDPMVGGSYTASITKKTKWVIGAGVSAPLSETSQSNGLVTSVTGYTGPSFTFGKLTIGANALVAYNVYSGPAEPEEEEGHDDDTALRLQGDPEHEGEEHEHEGEEHEHEGEPPQTPPTTTPPSGTPPVSGGPQPINNAPVTSSNATQANHDHEHEHEDEGHEEGHAHEHGRELYRVGGMLNVSYTIFESFQYAANGGLFMATMEAPNEEEEEHAHLVEEHEEDEEGESSNKSYQTMVVPAQLTYFINQFSVSGAFGLTGTGKTGIALPKTPFVMGGVNYDL